MAKKTKPENGYKLKYMILSVVIAIVAWSLVMYITDPDITKTISGVRVEVTGVNELREKGLIVLGEEDLPKMSVKIRGKRSDLMSAMDTMRVEVDVSGIDEAGDYIVEGSAKTLNSRTTVEKIISNEIPVTVDELQTRDLELTVRTEGDSGDKLVRSQPINDTVSVMGAKSELDIIENAYVTVDLTDVKESGRMSLPVSLGVTGSSGLATVIVRTPSVEVQNTMYTRKTVPVRVTARGVFMYELDAANSTVEPNTIEIGVGDDDKTEYVVAMIDTYSEGQCEAKVMESDGIYVPSESKTVHVMPVWLEMN